MRSKTYLILWKFFALSFVVVLVLGGCESDQTTTNSGRVSPRLNQSVDTAPTVVSVGTVYAKMTVTAVAEATQTTSARARESEPSRTAAASPPSLSTEEFLKQHRETWNPDKVLVLSCFPNCPTQVPTPQEIAQSILATEAAKNPTPTPTVVWKTKTVGSVSSRFRNMVGYGVVGQDGKYLGEIARPGAEIEYTSICLNPRVFEFPSKYGELIGDFSAVSLLASDPPIIVDTRGNFVMYVTANAMLSPRVSARALMRGVCG